MQRRDKSPRLVMLVSCLATSLTFMGHAARPASAQVLYGSIVGNVTDQTGAVVPSATLTVTNTSTGLSRQATSDAAGYYSIPNLPEGTYDLSISARGFNLMYWHRRGLPEVLCPLPCSSSDVQISRSPAASLGRVMEYPS